MSGKLTGSANASMELVPLDPEASLVEFIDPFSITYLIIQHAVPAITLALAGGAAAAHLAALAWVHMASTGIHALAVAAKEAAAEKAGSLLERTHKHFENL